MAITKTKAATVCHIRSVMSDSEYILAYKKLPKSDGVTKGLTELLTSFGLSIFDFKSREFLMFSFPHVYFSGGEVEYVKSDKKFRAEFEETIDRKQFEEMWVVIQKSKKLNKIKPTKAKPPVDWDLLYAIFKARRDNKSFPEIYLLYENGKLPGYKNKESRYIGSKSLEDHYRKYYKSKLV